MKTYVATTGVIFALIVLAHVGRVFAEGLHLTKDPLFIGLTVAAAALSLWAWRLVRRPPPS